MLVTERSMPKHFFERPLRRQHQQPPPQKIFAESNTNPPATELIDSKYGEPSTKYPERDLNAAIPQHHYICHLFQQTHIPAAS